MIKFISNAGILYTRLYFSTTEITILTLFKIKSLNTQIMYFTKTYVTWQCPLGIIHNFYVIPTTPYMYDNFFLPLMLFTSNIT